MPLLLRIEVWEPTAKCSYPKLAIGAKFYECYFNPLMSKSYLFFIYLDA